jgi:cellobiose phosphorylase
LGLKIGLEEIIGFKKTGNYLTINPKINKEWNEFSITYNYLDTKYLITIKNKQHLTNGVISTTLDNKRLKDNMIKLVNDKQEHIVIVTMKESL